MGTVRTCGASAPSKVGIGLRITAHLLCSERAFQTHQGRLPQELARAGIADMHGANRFLDRVYRPAHNREFGVASTLPGTAYVPFIGGFQELRHHYVRAKMRLHRYIDATLAISLGLRTLAAYDEQGALSPPKEALRAAA